MISFAEKVRREGKAEGLAETLTRMLGRKFTLNSVEMDQVRKVTDVAKLQAALDEIIEPHATADSVIEKLR